MKHFNIIKERSMNMTMKLLGAAFFILYSSFFISSCTEEPDGSNLFSSDDKTIAELLRERPDLSAFYRILEKGSFDKYMGTYGMYTCFAPLNDGVNSYLDSLYNDESYLISKAKLKHNGITEDANWNNLDVMAKVNLMSDSLCDDIARFHLSGEAHMQVDLDGTATTWTTMKIGRSIRVGTFGVDAYKEDFIGLTSLNDISAIIEGDIEASNGILHICSNVIPRSDRTTDDQLRVEGEKDLSIFYAALEATGYTDTLLIEKKLNADGTTKTYDLGNNHNDRDGNSLYYPKECLVKWTVFAETDDVFRAAGINNFDDLKKKCVEWYGNCGAWYDYINEKGITISTGDDYTNPFNVVNMFVAYHILRAGMPIDRIVYEKNARTQGDGDDMNPNAWNICFGYEPQEYFETMLPNTLLKVWETNPKSTKNLWLNRYLTNNTLTSKLGLFGMPGDGDHVLKFAGVPVDRNSSIETLNGYIHRIKGILKYDQNAKDALHERLRLDSSTFLYELINNGLRFATVREVSTLNGGGDGNRIAFQNNYFDNIVCYNPGTLLRFNVMGLWRAHNSDQFQGWDVYDFAIKLPHVPTGDYELRTIYPPMGKGGLMQFYLGNSPKQSDMVAIGIPFDACADPAYDATIGWEPIQERDDDHPDSDYGVECGQRMHVRGYMYGPASFSRGTYNKITDPLSYNENDIYSAASQIIGSTSSRSETGYGTMLLRRIITTQRFEQGKDYWLRIKNLVNDPNLGWSFDFVELVPLDIVNSQTMTEDWY
ncbi:MAG: fasciclin domain-containing protein [Prevotella sp.]|nr:fasciclin domain-containing protein [Prevotella sp.]